MSTNIATLNDTQITASTTTQLKQHLADSLELTAKHLMYLGQIWRELEERGEDLSELRHGLAAYLPMIANNRLDARLVIKYAGQKTLLSSLANLTMTEQKHLAENETITLIEQDGEEYQERQVALSSLSATQVFLAFNEDGLRTPSQQTKLLQRRDTKPKTAKKQPRKSKRVIINTDSKTLSIANSAADLSLVIEVLSKHYGKDLHEILQTATD